MDYVPPGSREPAPTPSAPPSGPARPPAEQGMMAVPAPPDSPAAGPAALPEVERRFQVGESTWRARSAGGGAGGTGGLGLAHFEAVHFLREGSQRPEYEALLPRGVLPHLHPEELARLLETATPIPG